MRTLDAVPAEVLTRADLLADGFRPKQITRAVKDGRLIRLRRDRYVTGPLHGVDRAVRVGGRLTCVSALQMLGAFVLDSSKLHIHVEHSMSRMRSPEDPMRPLSDSNRQSLVLHWWPLISGDASLGAVGIADAVGHAIRCQEPRAAVATVDSLLHLGFMGMQEIRGVFAMLPERYDAILRLADGIAESGPETLMRLILRQLGVRFEAQVVIPHVGRVDFLVDGWLIIECDSKAFHEGWDEQRADRRRDLAAAALGYTTIRPLAEDIMYNAEAVVQALRGLTRRARRAQ